MHLVQHNQPLGLYLSHCSCVSIRKTEISIFFPCGLTTPNAQLLFVNKSAFLIFNFTTSNCTTTSKGVQKKNDFNHTHNPHARPKSQPENPYNRCTLSWLANVARPVPAKTDCTSNDERNETQCAKVLFHATCREMKIDDTITGQEGQASVNTGPLD